MRPTTDVTDRVRLRAIADRLRERLKAQRVILFGSSARGEATEHSDIDLLVVAPTTDRFYDRMGAVLAAVRDISARMPLAPIVLTPEEVAARLRRGDQFVQEIVESGVDL